MLQTTISCSLRPMTTKVRNSSRLICNVLMAQLEPKVKTPLFSIWPTTKRVSGPFEHQGPHFHSHVDGRVIKSSKWACSMPIPRSEFFFFHRFTRCRGQQLWRCSRGPCSQEDSRPKQFHAVTINEFSWQANHFSYGAGIERQIPYH